MEHGYKTHTILHECKQKSYNMGAACICHRQLRNKMRNILRNLIDIVQWENM